MKQHQLAKWLKYITILIGLLEVFFFFTIVPAIGRDLTRLYPEFSYLFWPYLIWAWVAAIPCFFALVYVWRIICEVAKNNFFCRASVAALQAISKCALIDSVLCAVVSMIFLLSNNLHPGFLIAFLFVIAAGVAISMVSSALSIWVGKGVDWKEDSDLTI